MPDIARRNMPFSTKEVSREILLAFWKVHILHHASKEPLHGQWMLDELRHHGYQISPGTLYPLLARMERLGWLKSKSGRRAARAPERITGWRLKGRRSCNTFANNSGNFMMRLWLKPGERKSESTFPSQPFQERSRLRHCVH